jgi:hypothetical protein
MMASTFTKTILPTVIRRGDEIWQYYLGSEQYHSDWGKAAAGVFLSSSDLMDSFRRTRYTRAAV